MVDKFKITCLSLRLFILFVFVSADPFVEISFPVRGDRVLSMAQHWRLISLGCYGLLEGGEVELGKPHINIRPFNIAS